MDPRWTAMAIFVATYVLISLQRIRLLNLDRPTAAMTGAALMVVLGVLTLDGAYRRINHDTIALLLGTMIVIAYLREAGFFEHVSAWVVRRAGTPRRMLAMLCVVAGALSALFTNDTICVMFTPIVLASVRRAKLDPVPYLIALVTSANIGSVIMLTGNPQNMLIGITSGIPFARYLLVELPVGAVSLAISTGILLALYRTRLPAAFEDGAEAPPAIDRTVVRRVLGVAAAMLAGFLLPLEDWLEGIGAGQKLPLVALLGASAAVLVGRYRPEKTLKHVDGGLLLFFAGLFVVMGGVQEAGFLREPPPMGATPGAQTAAFGGMTVLGSNLVSNVPFVLIARDWIPHMAHPGLMWYVLATASTFAGNLTIVGSVANIIVLELSKDHAPIGFFTYLKAGLPITLATTAVGLAMLWAMAALGLPL